MQMVDDTNEQIAYLRSSAIGVLISECVRTFILHEEEILKGEFQGTLIQNSVQESEMPMKTAHIRLLKRFIARKM